MFYNGATQDAKWRIGWVEFDRHFVSVIDRCDKPLICPEATLGDGATDIAFVAAAVEHDGTVSLYYSQSDQDMRRATLELD